MDRLQVPPIRTALAEANGSTNTAKEWYLHWQQSGERVNQHADSIAGLDTAVQEIHGQLDELAKELGQTADDLERTIRYGTHAERLAATPDPIGGLWIETDRSNVVYQARDVAGTAAWVYVTGTMAGSLSQLPSGLGANDIYFSFATSDTYEVYRWSGAAWVNQTPGNLTYYAASTAGLVLTGSMQDVPGATLTVTRPGRYMATGTAAFSQTSAFVGIVGACLFNVAGGLLNPSMIFRSVATGAGATVGQTGIFTIASVPQTVKLQAYQNNATACLTLDATNTTLLLVWVGP